MSETNNKIDLIDKLANWFIGLSQTTKNRILVSLFTVVLGILGYNTVNTTSISVDDRIEHLEEQDSLIAYHGQMAYFYIYQNGFAFEEYINNQLIPVIPDSAKYFRVPQSYWQQMEKILQVKRIYAQLVTNPEVDTVTYGGRLWFLDEKSQLKSIQSVGQ